MEYTVCCVCPLPETSNTSRDALSILSRYKARFSLLVISLYMEHLTHEFLLYLDEIMGVRGSPPNQCMAVPLLQQLRAPEPEFPVKRSDLLLGLLRFIKVAPDHDIGWAVFNLGERRHLQIRIGAWQSEKRKPLNLNIPVPLSHPRQHSKKTKKPTLPSKSLPPITLRRGSTAPLSPSPTPVSRRIQKSAWRRTGGCLQRIRERVSPFPA